MWGAQTRQSEHKPKSGWGAQTSKKDKDRAVDQDDRHQYEGQYKVGLFGTMKKIK